MNWKRWIAFAVVAVFKANAGEKEEFTEMVNTFTDCAGVFEVVGDQYEHDGKKASADLARGQARGAVTVAAYLLALESGKNGKPRPIGDFFSYAQNRSDINKTAMLALLENDDMKGFEARLVRCAHLLDLQKKIVQQIRDGAMDR